MLSELLTSAAPLEVTEPKVPAALLVLGLPAELSWPAVFVPLPDETPEDDLRRHCMSELQT